jgi:cytochrome c556
MGKIIKGLAVLALVAAIGGSASGQFAKTDDAIAYRKAVMVLVAQHFGRIGALVKGEKPYDAKAAAANAGLIATLAPLPWEAFMAEGSDKGSTAMKPEALKEKDKFAQAAKAFETAAAALNGAAAGPSAEALKEPFGQVAQSCKGCHSQFKK